MQLVLAPMHGLADAVMREVLTHIGGFDECVSEFVRITHTVHSRPTWLRQIPELARDARTPAGVPCTVQILGSDADNMLANALVAVAAGAHKIDLNFGCPAPTVNRHQGGAILLKNPEHIHHIVATLRRGLPEQIPLTAKMRLGYEDTSPALECAHAIAAGGANGLTVHARTKVQGYAPPAHWEWIARIREAVPIPVTANGDIFSVDDFIRARDISGCTDFMLGRGAVQRPDLPLQIRAWVEKREHNPWTWDDILPWLALFFDTALEKPAAENYAVARLKQWLGMLQTVYPQAVAFFAHIRTLRHPESIRTQLPPPAQPQAAPPLKRLPCLEK